jgi:signal transduction histidine kinase/ActR/RegA family two-component response regulator
VSIQTLVLLSTIARWFTFVVAILGFLIALASMSEAHRNARAGDRASDEERHVLARFGRASEALTVAAQLAFVAVGLSFVSLPPAPPNSPAQVAPYFDGILRTAGFGLGALVLGLKSVLSLVVESSVARPRLRREAAYVADLERVNRKLEEAAQAKSAFLANMSHELRTPLNAILGFSELLTDQAGEVRSERQRRYLGNITAAGGHLLELINDVLDLAKVEAGKTELHPEPVALGVLMEPVVAAARASADHDDLRLEVSIDDAALVRVDTARVRQIFYNLSSNALKFTRAGGLVRITARVEGEDLVAEVADTGIGIAADGRGRLFGAFERVHDETTTKVAGTGLGLALTKRLVELHRGSIDCESEEGVGTTFRVRLPHLATAAVSGDRVLIVEDELRDAELVAALATRAGLRSEIVRSAEAARNAIARSVPVGIVLDLRLPDRRGEDVLRELKSDPITRGIPVIIVTVEDDDGRMRQIGADDHLTKPIAVDRLATWLARVSGRELAGPPAGR